MPPLRRAGDQVLHRGHRVHGGHVGVHVQLDALLLRPVLALDLLDLDQVAHGDRELAGIAVVAALAAQADGHADADPAELFLNGLALLVGDGRLLLLVLLAPAPEGPAVAQEALAQHGGGAVGDREGQQHGLAAAQFLRLHLEDLALDDHDAGLGGELLHLDGAVGDGAAEDRLADGIVLLAARLLLGLVGLVAAAELLQADGLGQGAALGGAHLLHLALLVAGDGQLHPHVGGEDVPDRLAQAGGGVLAGHVGARKLVGEGQRHAVAAAAPVDVRHPGHGAGVIPAQEIDQHLLVGADVGLEVVSEVGADHAQGEPALREGRAQDLFHAQEGLLLHQLVRVEGDVALVKGADKNHLRRVELPAQVGEFPVDPLHQIFIAHRCSFARGMGIRSRSAPSAPGGSPPSRCRWGPAGSRDS